MGLVVNWFGAAVVAGQFDLLSVGKPGDDGHATLTKDPHGDKVTSAMAARVERHVCTHRDIVALLD
jgi:hypothetical protein